MIAPAVKAVALDRSREQSEVLLLRFDDMTHGRGQDEESSQKAQRLLNEMASRPVHSRCVTALALWEHLLEVPPW